MNKFILGNCAVQIPCQVEMLEQKSFEIFSGMVAAEMGCKRSLGHPRDKAGYLAGLGV